MNLGTILKPLYTSWIQELELNKEVLIETYKLVYPTSMAREQSSEVYKNESNVMVD